MYFKIQLWIKGVVKLLWKDDRRPEIPRLFFLQTTTKLLLMELLIHKKEWPSYECKFICKLLTRINNYSEVCPED